MTAQWTGVGEDLVERENDRQRFRHDVMEAVHEAFPAGNAECIERDEGFCHGSDTMIAVLAPWTVARPGPLQRAAAARNLVWHLDKSGAIVGTKDGGPEVAPEVVQLRRYRQPRTAPTHPNALRFVWYIVLCVALFFFVHFVYLR
jgi:hypothetical protein